MSLYLVPYVFRFIGYLSLYLGKQVLDLLVSISFRKYSQISREFASNSGPHSTIQTFEHEIVKLSIFYIVILCAYHTCELLSSNLNRRKLVLRIHHWDFRSSHLGSIGWDRANFCVVTFRHSGNEIFYFLANLN